MNAHKKTEKQVRRKQTILKTCREIVNTRTPRHVSSRPQLGMFLNPKYQLCSLSSGWRSHLSFSQAAMPLACQSMGILRGQAMTILPDSVKVNKRSTTEAIPANQKLFSLAACGLAAYFGGAVERLVLKLLYSSWRMDVLDASRVC